MNKGLPHARPSLSSLAALLLLAGVSSCQKAAPPPAMPPPVVQVMPVSRQNIERAVFFIGQIDSPQNVQVRARVESFLEKVLFTEGSEIKEGDPLFELDKKPYQAKLAAAQAKLAEARAALAKSELDVKRLTPLVAQGAAPERELDNAKTQSEVNRANVQSAEASVSSAELDLGYCDIRAPLSGRIGAREVAVGSLVGKGEPTLLATISQTDPMWFYCSISEVDYLAADRLASAAGRKVGELPVTLILADGTEHPEPGKWVFVDRIVDATTATIRARVEFPNSRQALRPGMFGRARLNVPSKEGHVLIPERAVTDIQGKSFVWVLAEAGTVSQRSVTVAPYHQGANLIVLEGLEEGERIVTEGVHKLREGVPVMVAPAAAASAVAEHAPAAKPEAAAQPSKN